MKDLYFNIYKIVLFFKRDWQTTCSETTEDL